MGRFGNLSVKRQGNKEENTPIEIQNKDLENVIQKIPVTFGSSL